jgi:hypothetical protein
MKPRVFVSALLVLSLWVAACTGPSPIEAGVLRAPELGPPEVSIQVLAGDDLSAVAAVVEVDGIAVPVTLAGTAVFAWPGRSVEVAITADGFESRSIELEEMPPGAMVEVRLKPIVLNGRVATPGGGELPGVVVTLGGVSDLTKDDGSFEIERAVPGELVLTRPAWADTIEAWDGVSDQIVVTMEPRLVHAVRVGSEVVGDAGTWADILAMAGRTGVNAFVIDVKDEFGNVLHDTDVARASEVGAVRAFYDLADVITDMDEHELYKIARVGVFQDTPMATAEPEHAVTHSITGELWETNNGQRWLDPSDPAAYEYSIALAAEACRAGFDEIQFDFASFPFGGDISTAVFDAEYNEEARVNAITAFLDRAYGVLNPMGCAVGANVLGITLESATDEGVGQRPGLMSRTVDVLSPMLYTTNYGAGWKGFTDPDDHAVEVVSTALAAGVSRLEGFAYYRPWLQTWTIDAADVRAVQRTAEDREMGWMLWSGSSTYPSRILPTS